MGSHKGQLINSTFIRFFIFCIGNNRGRSSLLNPRDPAYFVQDTYTTGSRSRDRAALVTPVAELPSYSGHVLRPEAAARASAFLAVLAGRLIFTRALSAYLFTA